MSQTRGELLQAMKTLAAVGALSAIVPSNCVVYDSYLGRYGRLYFDHGAFISWVARYAVNATCFAAIGVGIALVLSCAIHIVETLSSD